MEIKNVDGFLIQGNYIGTDASGNKAVPNGVGVRFSEDPKYLGLGESIFSDNVVSGNRSHGIEINGLAQHAVVGNVIGIAKDGVTALANCGSGIKILKIHNLDCIGGMADSQTNQIAFNNLYGIEIFSGEFHSVDAENLGKTNRVYNNLHSDFLIDGAKKEKGNN
jgi:nitrous oxidase accessory protein NosD